MTSTADRWQVASRANVPPFHVMDLLAAAHTGSGRTATWSTCWRGSPSTGAPAPVRAEAIRLLEGTDPLGYTPAVGILELREAIAGHHQRAYGVDVDPDEVIVTTAAAAGSCWRSSRRSRSATRWRWPGRATPATATC